MRLAMLFIAVFALSILLPATVETTYAHGGAYRGPAGEVPPGQRDPKDPQPPPDGQGTPDPRRDGSPETPPPGNPSGDGSGGTPDTPPPPPTPPEQAGGEIGPGNGRATPSGRNRPPQMSFTNWLFWWGYNKDEILNLKAKVKGYEDQAVSTAGRYFRNRGKGGRTVENATPRMIRERIVPALVTVIENRKIHPDIRGGAIIALARAEPTEKHFDRFFAIAARGSDENKIVKESAIIALGLLQVRNADVRTFLIDVVTDRDYPMRGRCFAMLSLGLLKDDDPYVLKTLEARVTDDETHLDVPVCALLAIGLIGDEDSVPKLVGWLESGRAGGQKLRDQQKAWIVAALGKIGSEKALKAIRATLRGKDRLTRRSAAIALGQIVPGMTGTTPIDNAKVLARFYTNDKDLTARNFAMMSLGRIGGAADATPETREFVSAFLRRAFRESSRLTERPFVALAMGLVGFDTDPRNRKPAALKEELARVIRTDLATMRGDQKALGAQAIALGMLGDDGSVDLLTKILADRGRNKHLRGAAAIGLGLIGDRSANEVILRTLNERQERKLRVDTAVAAGLLSHSDAVDALVKVVGDRKSSQFTLGSVALALGQIGDRRAIDPMVMILEPGKVDGRYPDLTRALVAVALGQLADRRDVRVLSRLSKDINYRAAVSALDEILTIL